MNKEETAGLNKSSRVAIVIMMVLVATGLVFYLIAFVADNNLSKLPIRIVDILMYIFVLYYGLWGYKRPHGNLLKYLMLLYGVSLIPTILIPDNNQTRQIVYPIAVLFIGYMSGRLNKLHKNRIIAIIVTFLLFIVFIVRTFGSESAARNLSNPFDLLHPLSPIILWLAICAAYFSRYQLHKEAGLQDKPV